jgi:hypothetical protein
MSTLNTFLAVFLGSKTSAKMAAWNDLSEVERKAREQEGIAAWKDWTQRHQGAIVAMGGPLGKTKKIAPTGIEDITNAMAAFTIVQAECMRRPQSSSSITHTSRASRGIRSR